MTGVCNAFWGVILHGVRFSFNNLKNIDMASKTIILDIINGKLVKQKKKSFLCRVGFHKWYNGDGKGGVFCKNECYKCGKQKLVTM